MKAGLTFLAAAMVATVAACAPKTSGPGASASRAVEQDIAAARGSGPVSARPGAPQANRRPRGVEGQKAEPPAIVRSQAEQGVPTGAFAPQSGVAADPSRGRAFALDNCRPCHVVARDQGSPVRFADAPDFHAIANMPATTRVGLNVWLTNPHPSMPTLVLTQAEADDVIAYIMSLRDKH